MHQLEPGSEFAGFVIEGVIGTGGMSVLYRARDPHLQRVVALKIMSAALADDDDFRRRFADEARLAAAIDHPNVVPIYGFGQVGDSLYIAMRYVPGTDLRKVLQVESPLGMPRIAGLLGQVAAALDVVHRRGMVHRDVKPDNVLITPPAPPDHVERAYLADFGLTRSDTQSRITQAGQIVGTLAYAAPEQLRGEEVGAAADVYSLGCVLYECLVGERPFRRNNDAAVIYAHLHDPPPRVSDSRPDLPPALDAMVATALAKEASGRFASAGQLMRAFRVAAGLEAGPDTGEIFLAGTASGGEVAGPPVEVWTVPISADTDGGDRGQPTPTSTTVAAAPPVPALEQARSRRPLVLAALALLALTVAGVAILLVGRGNGGNGSSGDAVENPGDLVDQDGTALSSDLDVKAFRTISVDNGRREATVTVRLANRSATRVIVAFTESPPPALLTSQAQLRRVDPPLSSSGSAPAGGTSVGSSAGRVVLPFRATLAPGADALFEYVIELPSAVDDADLQQWAAGFPAAPVATVEAPDRATTTTTAQG
jgi:serine/threonine-protein kinase